jgi:hypothetical protein
MNNRVIYGALLTVMWLQTCNSQQERYVNQEVVTQAVQPVSKTVSTKIPIHCFILKPIPRNVSYEWKGTISKDTGIVAFVEKIPKDKTIRLDTNAIELLSFEMQQRILLNSNCVEYLENPDTMGLSYLYSSSRFSTSDRTRSNVEFVNLYEDHIFKFGQAYIYEYRLHGGSLVEPSYAHLIIPNKSANNYGNEYDYEGIVLYSDGLEWQQVNNIVVPIHIKILRSGMEIKTPLVFDGAQFIPVGRFRKD